MNPLTSPPSHALNKDPSEETPKRLTLSPGRPRSLSELYYTKKEGDSPHCAVPITTPKSPPLAPLHAHLEEIPHSPLVHLLLSTEGRDSLAYRQRSLASWSA